MIAFARATGNGENAMEGMFPVESDHPLFKYLSASERAQVEDLGSVLSIASDGFLIREGQKDSALFSVESGRLEVVTVRDGEENVVATIGPGDVLGEVSFIDNSPRTVSVRAVSDSEVRVWDRSELVEHLRSKPDLLAKFSIALSELLVERLRDSVRRQGRVRPV